MPVAQRCRKYEFSDASFYKCRTKFSGMDASKAWRLRELEGESVKLKKLLVGVQLDMEARQIAFGVKR